MDRETCKLSPTESLSTIHYFRRRRKDSNLRGSSPIRFQGGAVSPLRHSSSPTQQVHSIAKSSEISQTGLTQVPPANAGMPSSVALNIGSPVRGRCGYSAARRGSSAELSDANARDKDLDITDARFSKPLPQAYRSSSSSRERYGPDGRPGTRGCATAWGRESTSSSSDKAPAGACQNRSFRWLS